MTANYTDPILQEAGLNLALAGVTLRMRLDGTKPNSLSLPTGLSMSDNVDSIVAYYEKTGWEQVEKYLAVNKRRSSTVLAGSVRADEDMPDFHLNQRVITKYQGDD